MPINPSNLHIVSASGSNNLHTVSTAQLSNQKEPGQGSLLRDILGRKHTNSSNHLDSDGAKKEESEAPGLRRTPSESVKLSRTGSEASLTDKYGRVARNEVVGKGATATIRLAHKTGDHDQEGVTETLYAVKEFRKRRRDETQKEYIKKLIAEFCISSNMHHENVIETVDLIQDERERWCEVMEYMPGGDLYTLLASKECPTSPPELYCLFIQLLHGVQYLHSVGVAHRDLKPENLLLDADSRILKITDFGVSEVFKTCFESLPRKARGIRGSEPYIPPEEWTGLEYDAPKVDVWACGIIFYTLIHRCIPWRVAKVTDPHYCAYSNSIKHNSTKDGPRPTSGYPPFDRTPVGPRKLLYRMLDPNPAKRWTIEEVLEDEWVKTVDICRVGKPCHRHGSKATV
ncbi:kinase-like domain-containing protein [Gaertneriomyces semiglobifer]|nr:kinase-like domain-containing protein [Gaertneriomyces semiglobifer]